MVRWFGYSASFGLVCVLVASGGVGAQAPGAPAVGSVTGGDQALTVSWTVPAGVDEVDITRYDLRYIETDAPDKTDPNWTVVERVWSSGPLAYVLTGLANGIGYDVQVRAVTTVDGGWSVTAVGTPTEPSSTQTAITLPFDIQVGGVIDPGSDTDYFKVATNETVHVFIKAVSEDLRLGGDLLDEASQSTGAHVYTQFPNDPLLTLSSYDHLLAHIPMDSRVLVVRTRLEAGTYYLKVNRTGGAISGSYTIEVVEDPDYAFSLDRCPESVSTVSDPLYGCQWHLKNTGQFGGTAGEDINVEEVWEAGILGEGINVVVVDSGLDVAHEDLRENVLVNRNYDLTVDTSGIFNPYSYHGTAVAGIIAARDNESGGRGVAPRAKIFAFNLLRKPSHLYTLYALIRHMDITAVANYSAGPPDDGRDWQIVDYRWRRELEIALDKGYGGKGVFFVRAAGDGALQEGNANLDERANHYGVTAVCAVNNQGTRAEYSEKGANLWVCAPSSPDVPASLHIPETLDVPATLDIPATITGDRIDARPGITTTSYYNGYRTTFGGTSAAAPIVSGVAALVRSANNDLTWRDVKLILASSARKNDPTNTGWETGGNKYESPTETYHFNHEYGFGVVDAKAAVDLAETWTNLPPLIKDSHKEHVMQNIPVSGTISFSIDMGSEVEFVEYVTVETGFYAWAFRSLLVELISPSGKISVLDPSTRFNLIYSAGAAPAQKRSPRYGSAKYLGERAEGTWTLRVTESEPVRPERYLRSWGLIVYGHRTTPGIVEITSAISDATAFEIVWNAPENVGVSEVTAYDVRHRTTEADDWTVIEDAGTADTRTYTITELTNGTTYDVQVRAVNGEGDGRWSDTTTITVGNNPPSFIDGDAATRSLPENKAAGVNIGLPIAATDYENDTLSYSLGGEDADSFDFDTGSGQLRTKVGVALDHETKDRYHVTVSVSDGKSADDGASTETDATIGVTIIVVDVDEKPEITGKTVLTYEENRTDTVADYQATDPESKVITWSLSGPDARKFYINRGGWLGFVASPDYERRADSDGDNDYQVTVRAFDGATTGRLAVTVTVTNLNDESPQISGEDNPIYEENSEHTIAQYTASDPDGETTFRWYLSGPDASEFTISSNGELTFGDSPDYENPTDSDPDGIYQVTVNASDGTNTGRLAVTVTVTDADESVTTGLVTTGVITTMPVTTVPVTTVPVTTEPVTTVPVTKGPDVTTRLGGGGEESPPRASELFEDVAAGVWYESAVSWMILHKVTSGCTTKLFCPDDDLTRQQFVTFLWRAAGRPTPTYTGSQAFSDVNEGVYSDQAIGWAVSKGITLGCTTGQLRDPDWKFCPRAQVTRGQMATFLYRHAETDHTATTTPYTDVEPDSFYADSVAWLTDFQVVPGCTTELFCPNRDATRAEAALFIHGVATLPHTWGTDTTPFPEAG